MNSNKIKRTWKKTE